MTETDAGETATRTDSSIGPMDALMLWTSLTSLISVGLLWSHHFRTVYAAASGAALVIVILWIGGVSIAWRRPRFHPIILLSGIVGLAVRIDRYPYLMGGQDEGLYTNMAIQMRRTGSVFFQDRLRSQLSESLVALYDRSGIAGLHLVDSARSIVTIDFYPLHPIWMAMFGSVVGESRQNVSLLFFAFLGVVMAMGIARELLPGTWAPVACAVFIAVNPALAFFAKFPVTETVAGAFALAGFYHLLRACNPVPSPVRFVHMVTSIASFGALCFVRFQLFLYLPFFAVVILLAFTRYFSSTTRWVVLGVLVPTVGMLQLSLLYYWSQQPLLYTIAMLSIRPHIHAYMIIGALLAVIALAAVYAELCRRGRWHWVNRAANAMLRHAGVLLVLAFLASIPSILTLYQTGDMAPWHYIVDPTGDAWMVRYHALWRLMLMVSPIGFVTLVGLAAWRNLPRRVGGAIVLLALCWCGVLLQPYVPYLYYYGRYLAADIVPLSLILCAVVVGHLAATRHRLAAVGLAGAVVACSLPFSLLQIGRIEGEQVGFTRELARHMDDEDVVVFGQGDDRVLLPLRFAYDRLAIVIPDPARDGFASTAALHDLYLATRASGARMFVARRAPVTVPGLQLEMSGQYEMDWLSNTEHWQDGGLFDSSSALRLMLPSRRGARIEPWYVYEVEPGYFGDLDCDGPIDLSTSADSGRAVSGFMEPSAIGRWTSNAATISCDVDDGIRPTSFTLTVSEALVTPEHHQRLVVSVDDVQVADFTFTVDHPSGTISGQVPPGSGDHVTFAVSTPDAVTPASLGLSADQRVVGLAIHNITLFR